LPAKQTIYGHYHDACSGVTTYGALRKLADIYPSEPIVVIGTGRTLATMSQGRKGKLPTNGMKLA